MPRKFLPHPALCCPLDQLPLEPCDGGLQCERGHVFDIARLGYVNLLAAQDKRSRDPGDSKAMVKARSYFLGKGHYEPIARSVVEAIGPLLDGPATIVDAGCGDGYYLAALADQLADSSGSPFALVGFDISKWAVQAAARRCPATWLVASNRQIPLSAGSADILLSLFGFPHLPEFARLVRRGGYYLSLDAGADHLLELRRVIYPDLRPERTGEPLDLAMAGFDEVVKVPVHFQTPPLGPEDLSALLTMTPHLYRASREGLARAQGLADLSLTASVNLSVWQRQ